MEVTEVYDQKDEEGLAGISRVLVVPGSREGDESLESDVGDRSKQVIRFGDSVFDSVVVLYLRVVGRGQQMHLVTSHRDLLAHFTQSRVHDDDLSDELFEET